jgi:hypothetical protein
MNVYTIISDSINSLQELSGKNVVFLEDLPSQFRSDLQKFIVGETLSMKDGKLVIGSNLYKMWLNKIRTKGFDYEIDWKQ